MAVEVMSIKQFLNPVTVGLTAQELEFYNTFALFFETMLKFGAVAILLYWLPWAFTTIGGPIAAIWL